MSTYRFAVSDVSMFSHSMLLLTLCDDKFTLYDFKSKEEKSYNYADLYDIKASEKNGEEFSLYVGKQVMTYHCLTRSDILTRLYFLKV
jgi:hypothetical protein